MTVELVGFSGYARSGKDTAVEALVDTLGYKRVAFADVLRDFLYRLDPIVCFDFYEKGYATRRLQSVIDSVGWDGYKQTEYAVEIRELLQRLGTECGRQLISDDVWVRAALDNLPDGKYAVADVRFPNEYDAVKNRGGNMFRIMRAGIGPANSHASEISLDQHDFDAYIHNDGDIEDFRKSVVRRVIEIASRN